MTNRASTRLLAALTSGLLLLVAACSGPVPTSPLPPAISSPEAPASPEGRESAEPSPAKPTPAPTPAGPTVRLAFGGDVMFENDLRELLVDPERGLDPITEATSAADFTMVNLESALTRRGTRDPKELEKADSRYYFRTGPEALTALKAAGVDAVSVANNHGVDFGARGLSDTLATQRDGVLPVIGVGRNLAAAFTPHRVSLRGEPFAFLAADASFLESEEPYWQAGPRTPGLAAARGPGRAALIAAVRRAVVAGDTVIVYLHWGKENTSEVVDAQRKLARSLADAGAAAVVGSHTHRLQGAGWMKSTYVAYGLGNFLWYHGVSGAETGLLDLTVRDGRVVADGWRPALIPREGGLPEFLSGAAADGATQDWRELRRGSGLAATPPARPVRPPRFDSSIDPIGATLRRRMASTHRANCPVQLSDLRYLRVSYWDFRGRAQQGELIVAAKHAKDVVAVFRTLFEAEFPLQRMVLVSDYDGDDDASMAANNSSAYNCRTVAGTDRWSQHSFGAALDLNPVQNPYVTSAGVYPPAGERYATEVGRRASVPGMITPDSVVVEAFRAVGWEWGGDWQNPRDYQHFSAAGS